MRDRRNPEEVKVGEERPGAAEDSLDRKAGECVGSVMGWKAKSRFGRRPTVAEAEMTGEAERDP